MSIKRAERLASVQEYYFSTKLREIRQRVNEGEVIHNLGIGSPDLPPDPGVIEVLNRASHDHGANQYQSYQGLPELREAFSEYYQRLYGVSLNSNSEILTLLGSKEGIMHISMAFLNPGDQVLVPNPGYGAYAACARLAGGEPIYYPLLEDRGWAIDMNYVNQLEPQKIKLIWLNSPHMPTGQVHDSEQLNQLIRFASKHRILICHDNPYSTILTERPTSIFQIEGAREIAIELNSLSKSHNLAGWRVGMVGGSAQYIESILKFKSNMNSGQYRAIQVAAAYALSLGDDWFLKQDQEYSQRQKAARKLLGLLGCEVSEPDGGMFLWAKKPQNMKDGIAASEYFLNQHGIFVAPGSIFGSLGHDFVRMSLCAPIEIYQTLCEQLALQKHTHV